MQIELPWDLMNSDAFFSKIIWGILISQIFFLLTIPGFLLGTVIVGLFLGFKMKTNNIGLLLKERNFLYSFIFGTIGTLLTVTTISYKQDHHIFEYIFSLGKLENIVLFISFGIIGYSIGFVVEKYKQRK
jgi:uncharacterized membrane protein YsdA (DUF1294 family)